MPEPITSSDFESIRPYRDAEVPEVVTRLVQDPWLIQGAARLALPGLHRLVPRLARWLARLRLQQQGRMLRSVADVQAFLYRYMMRLVRETIVEFQCTGFDALEGTGPFLFVSNHRDIVLDSGLLNVALRQVQRPTCRLAIGDNLFEARVAADLMRLNKGFVVKRSVSGTKAVFAAMNLTSRYIRSSLAEGESVWIAQRAGRAKDGIDRTEPAVLKMLGLAYREEVAGPGALATAMPIVPVSVSYELDPCDLRKARELHERAVRGQYRKGPEEDLQSIVEGLAGAKGRVRLHVSRPITNAFESVEALAQAVDRAVVGGFEIFPTHVQAARLLGRVVADSRQAPLPRVMEAFSRRVESVNPAERPHLLAQYANVFDVRRALGLDPPDGC